MITRNIPKDISKYKAKLMLGLTTRQVVLFAPGVAAAVGVFFLTKDSLGDLALFLALLTALPFVAFAAFKPLGMPLEQFIQKALLPMLLSPVKRKYQSENTYLKSFKALANEAAPESDEKEKGKKKPAPKATKSSKTYKSKNSDIQAI